ncbi:hypothetical protein KBTX_00520 [wastewater metagenome]|uniref:Mce/MlaD domain-containing protein n=3 Tax=root TaxID=1 RepID=A0A5B8R6D3_9ZZZZ|nr:MlaD family protein [Arhodomonas aquaeolei]QEA04216.1 hypothetical protein KBTEX_00520 [uncultured organism]
MGNRVNYTLVGLFVVGLTLATVVLGLWLADSLQTGETRRYSVYLTDTASGLGRDSPVTYRGVDVGQVHALDIDPEHPERVHAIIALRSDLPVREGIAATLKMRGLTGIAYLDLAGGDPGNPPLEAEAGERYPVIPYHKSLLMRLDTAVTQGLDTLDTLSQRVGELLSRDNREAVDRSLENLATVSEHLAANSERLDRIIADSERLLERVNTGAERIGPAFEAVEGAAHAIQRTAESLSRTSEEIAELGNTGENGMRRLSETTLPRVDALTGELRELSRRMGRLVDNLSEDPQQVLYGRQRPEPGPGEE